MVPAYPNLSSFVPHDMAALIPLLGGASNFVKRLDYLHDKKITYIGNEPAFLTVYQYHYAGRPAKSTARARTYIPDYFSPTPAGLPGNDDSGAMGSFVAMSMMGLFPNPGQSVYLITVPFFESVSIVSPLTGKTATLRVVNWDKFNSVNNTGETGFIQSATLNGVPYTKNWVDHDFFTEGKDLVLVLGRNESSWGTGPDDVPPSLSDDTAGLSARGLSGVGVLEDLEEGVPLRSGGGAAAHKVRHVLHADHHKKFAGGALWQKGW